MQKLPLHLEAAALIINLNTWWEDGMKNKQNQRGWMRRLWDCYRNLPRDLKSDKPARRRRAQSVLVTSICIPVMILCLGYMIHWEVTRIAIERDNAAFSALYAPVTLAPTAAPTLVPTAVPTAEPTQAPTPEPTAAPTPEPTQAPAETAAPTAEPTYEPTREPTAAPTSTPEPFEVAVDATLIPLATPDADTIVYALETPPPNQYAFGDLLALNPETVAFLRIGDFMSLPVVHKANDNEYYLNHNFALEESIAGTLFLDGSNLIVPEDKNLIVYGHNMRNGTMFRPLLQYEQLSFLKENPIVRFDTIHQNRDYVPFAVFTVTADPGSERYMNIRQFLLDEPGWEDYIAEMRRLSMHNIPVDVQYGDNVLLLVTCEYTHNNGRFVVALRALRDGETRQDMTRLINQTM